MMIVDAFDLPLNIRMTADTTEQDTKDDSSMKDNLKGLRIDAASDRFVNLFKRVALAGRERRG